MIKIKDGIISAVPNGAQKGWITKWRKRAEFWEAEAKRLGSTAMYNMKNHSKYGGPAIDTATGQLIDPVTAERIVAWGMTERQLVEGHQATVPLVQDEPIFSNVACCEVGGVDLDADVEARRWDEERERKKNLPTGINLVVDPVGMRCIVPYRSGCNTGVIAGGIKNKAGHPYIYKAYTVEFDDGTKDTYWCSEVDING